MKIRAVVQMTNEIDNNKLDVLNFRLIIKIVNDAPEYTWLNETEDIIYASWYKSIPEARRNLFNLYNFDNMVAINFYQASF